MNRSTVGALVACCSLASPHVCAQTAANLAALKGLAPVSILLRSSSGKSALAANLRVTCQIQTGALAQPLLMSFADQQQQALEDAFITDGNAAELADGLGTTLATAYRAKARYTDATSFTTIAPAVDDLIIYTNNITKTDSAIAKYFFANETLLGKQTVSDTAKAILTAISGTTDVFGVAYDLRGGAFGADRFGNSRPFQTAPRLLSFRGADYFSRPSNSLDWLRGPVANLIDSPAYPSGHTTYGYTQSVLLAIMVPSRYRQMITRAAEFGNDRIIIGAHYAMDVLGGRATALHALAHLLANDPDYLGAARSDPGVVGPVKHASAREVTITDYPRAMESARAALRSYLEDACGARIDVCADTDEGRFKNLAADQALYDATQTYGLPVVHPEMAGRTEDVEARAPEAGYLLMSAFPALSLHEADAILTSTEGPGGGFLDDGSAFGIYSRIDLFAAASRASSLVAEQKGKSATAR